MDKPSLEALSYILRNPRLWPKGFIWDFGDCGSCAMGMAYQLWNVCSPNVVDAEQMPSIVAPVFGMSYSDAKNIFLGDESWTPMKTKIKVSGPLWWKRETAMWKFNHKAVTPDMVADQIDAYLARQKA